MDDTGREYLQIAQRELERVVHITTQTLRFYRQSTRPVRPTFRSCSKPFSSLYEARLRSNSIAVVRRYRPIPPITVFDGEVRQVLANLVVNAIDAIVPKQNGRLFLRTSTSRDGLPDAKNSPS